MPKPSVTGRGLSPVPTPDFPSGAPPAPESIGPIRLALIDADGAFARVLIKRADALSWPHREFAAPARIEELVAMRPNAVVIDLALCGYDGWDYLAAVAAELPDVALIVATERSTVAQRARGLRLGADDWITKPSHPEEVAARVQAVVRRRLRSALERAPEPTTHGELQVRPDRFQGYVGGESLSLTRREFELLVLLAEAGDQVLEREEIYRRVWGYEMAHGDRSVDVFVRKLRKKLEAASPGWRYIHTHFGVGYRFQPEPADEE